ncbi:hypothetical protein CDD83_1139 [Cordyceps sp. RAO-2017]|nr:hypothetical protein CDD83_1139 [Cordyceps sp. RAO-2017]
MVQILRRLACARPWYASIGSCVLTGSERLSDRCHRLSWRRLVSSSPAARGQGLRREVGAGLKMAPETNYDSWTKTSLIQRLQKLETELATRPAAAHQAEAQDAGGDAPAAAGTRPPTTTTSESPAAAKGKRKLDPSRYSTRYIALKLAYLGKRYGGFEFQPSGNQPSIEEELWKALTKSCLIFPEDERVVDFGCCEYSKCGRTDRGVSAFGQVVGLRVRSNRPLPSKRRKREGGEQGGRDDGDEDDDAEAGGAAEEAKAFDDVADELCYPKLLNRILPGDIRILAWCPSPPADFSARFSCRERQYRYFFTQPAFSPQPSWLGPACGGASGSVRPGWLDIEAMRDAAKRFEGENDFRNLCKIDPAKQITNFSRFIFESDIVEVEDGRAELPYLQEPGFAAAPGGGGPHPKVYYFHVRGSAFLWHQIRHMVAILFLVGQGLERPSVVSELLDVATNRRKPSYTMADEVPLVLWDCVFPDLDGRGSPPPGTRTRHEDALRWIRVGDGDPAAKHGHFGIVDGLWERWRAAKMDELLAQQLLGQVARQGVDGTRGPAAGAGTKASSSSVKTFEGGNGGRLSGKYIPVMRKQLQQPAEEQNDRYAQRKGYADAADMRAQKAADWERDVTMDE